MVGFHFQQVVGDENAGRRIVDAYLQTKVLRYDDIVAGNAAVIAVVVDLDLTYIIILSGTVGSLKLVAADDDIVGEDGDGISLEIEPHDDGTLGTHLKIESLHLRALLQRLQVEVLIEKITGTENGEFLIEGYAAVGIRRSFNMQGIAG